MYRALNAVRDAPFPGFDGNDEGEHYHYARFMLEDLGRWKELAGDELNSHQHMLPGYRRMLPLWKASAHKLKLTKEEADKILNAAEEI
jgi:uncharacterized protein YfbU (UPF0304 family)